MVVTEITTFFEPEMNDITHVFRAKINFPLRMACEENIKIFFVLITNYDIVIHNLKV